MAKWGEGDPRWIVEDRPDSTNVNNWHWTEKNCFSWVETYLKDSIGKIVLEDGGSGSVKVTSVTIEGEATVGNRKGKIYYIYELNATVKWKGENETSSAEGKVKISDITQDDSVNDYGYKVTFETETEDNKSIRTLAQKQLIPALKQSLEGLKRDLKAEHEKNVLLPTAKQATSPPPTGTTTATTATTDKSQSTSAPKQEQQQKPAYGFKTVKMTVELLASGHDVYESLLDPQRVQQWTRAKVQISRQPGSQFSLFDGAITGEIISVVQDKKIEQKWRLKDWPQGHFSRVVIEIEQGSNSTELILEQTDVPSEQFDSTNENWHRFFWNQLKGVFGWGVLN